MALVCDTASGLKHAPVGQAAGGWGEAPLSEPTQDGRRTPSDEVRLGPEGARKFCSAKRTCPPEPREEGNNPDRDEGGPGAENQPPVAPWLTADG